MSEAARYSNVAGPAAVDRAARIAKAINADPETPAFERDWTEEDVLAVALQRGLSHLEELYVDGRPIPRAKAEGDAR